MLMDAGRVEGGGAWPVHRTHQSGPLRYAANSGRHVNNPFPDPLIGDSNYMSIRHMDGGNVLYLDGSAERVLWMTLDHDLRGQDEFYGYWYHNKNDWATPDWKWDTYAWGQP